MPITLEDIMAVPNNGAHFYTADLHVHSYGASADVRDPTMTVEAIIDAAVQHRIALLSITDHNSAENILRALSYATKYAAQLLVLPGVEITTAHGHLLVYFAPEKAECVRDLLARVEIEGKHGSRESHTRDSMATVISKAESLGGVCVAAHIDRAQCGFETQPGYPNWKRDIILASGLYGLEVDEPTHLVWYSVEDETTPSGDERKKLISARACAGATAARARLAAVQGSDAHSLKDFVERNQKRLLTRFKMNELCFEGFRTALIDPEARVRAVATIPRAIPRILGMRISGGFLDRSTLHFSDNLNCFIGGRGTGKSTSIQSLAYGLGQNDAFAAHDNCPDNVVVYAEDEAGVRYRYERVRGEAPSVRAKDDQSITDVPADAFRVEFYGQGELAEVAKDPLSNPAKLQEFLDRHILLKDLRHNEKALLQELEENSAQLIPLEASAAQLSGKQKSLDDIAKKVQIAEAGKLKEVAGCQSRLASERSFCTCIEQVQKAYQTGLSLSDFKRSYEKLLETVGPITGNKGTEAKLSEMKRVIDAANDFIDGQEKSINGRLKEFADALRTELLQIDVHHRAMEQAINAKITEFQAKGLSGDLKGFGDLIRQRTALTSDIGRIAGQQAELTKLRALRNDLLQRLDTVREEMTNRRVAQLRIINKNLRTIIEDYAINLYYDKEGITDEFVAVLLAAMHGTYLQAEMARALCQAVAPARLAELIRVGNLDGIITECRIDRPWAEKLLRQLRSLNRLHSLEVLAKPPKPVIKVLTKGVPPKQLAVNQLSDGQKHTILLTIAMLAESNLPLIMDQPEDDLDNAFIFKSVVSTLRAIKERRQVLVVTHNANIAVLGDSELIFPMRRIDDTGTVTDRGSIDRPETAKAVQQILEGGEIAFRRRQEIYGH